LNIEDKTITALQSRFEQFKTYQNIYVFYLVLKN